MHCSATARWPRASSLLLSALALAVPACATSTEETPAPGDFTAGGEPAEAAAEPARVVATIDAPDGARLVFLDEAAPGAEADIGIEILSSSATPVTDALFAHDPTALELFMALAPAEKAPLRLVLEHERTRGAAPRRLAVATATGESSGYFDCADTAAWVASFQAWAPVLDGEYISAGNESGYTTGYVGYSPTFYFDVCRPADLAAGLGAYYTGVQRRSGPSGTWTLISSNTGALNYQYRRWRYYRTSITCSSYEYRLAVNSPVPNVYRRAARYADEWSCQASQ